MGWDRALDKGPVGSFPVESRQSRENKADERPENRDKLHEGKESALPEEHQEDKLGLGIPSRFSLRLTRPCS